MDAHQFDLITGSQGHYYYFESEILKRIEDRMLQGERLRHDFIYFLPVKRAVRCLKERILTQSSGAVLADLPVFTFYDFMVDVYRQMPGARKVISKAMRLFLVEEVLKSHVEQLKFFTSVSARRRGLVRKVDKLLEEFREYGYSASELGQYLDEDARIDDFSLLISGFEDILEPRGLIDEAGAINAVCDEIEKEPGFWAEEFPHTRTVYLSGYGLFTRPMFRFVNYVRRHCDVKIKIDYLHGVPGRSHTFSHVDPAFEELKSYKPSVIESPSPQKWEKELFRRQSAGAAPLPFENDILIQATTDRHEEVAFIAAYVKRLHHDKGVPLHKIGITFPEFERYASMIHEVFTYYELPYNISAGYPLSQSPLIRTFLLVLEVVLNQYDVVKLLQLINSPFYSAASPAVDAVSLKNLTKALRLSRMEAEWQEQAGFRAGIIRQRLNELQQTGETNGAWEAELQLLESDVVAETAALLERFRPLESRQSAADFRNAFLQILDELKFLDWYQSSNVQLLPTEREREYRAFNRFIKLLDQFSWIVTNLHGTTNLSLKEFHQYLSLLIYDATYNLREWSEHGVQIMPRLEIQAMLPEVLIFGGMIEGNFPRPFSQDVFFHDEEREQLGLVATEDLLAQDRFMLYELLSCSARRFVFTYPRFEKEAARVPSNFLNVLSEQFRVRWRTSNPSQQFLLNRRRLINKVSRNISDGIRPSDLNILRTWKFLAQHDPYKLRSVALWLDRVHQIFMKRQFGKTTAHEGMLEQFPAIKAALASRHQDVPFSVTRLETYAYCPIKYFFKYIVKIEEEAEVEDGLTPIERGNLVHDTLFRFYLELREAGIAQRPRESLARLKEIAVDEFAKLHISGLLFELEKERYFGNGTRKGLWEMFLQEDQEKISALGYTPAYFEVAFGRAGDSADRDQHLSRDQAIVLRRGEDQLSLTGKIDRIDVSDDGKMILVDYKTGSSLSKMTDLYRGTSLQLPVYAIIANDLLSETENPAQAVGLFLFQVKDEVNCFRMPLAFDREVGLPLRKSGNAPLPNARFKDNDDNPLDFEAMLERSRDFVFQFVENIESGKFCHTQYPDEDQCESFCEYRRMCRKDVKKMIHNREKQPALK